MSICNYAPVRLSPAAWCGALVLRGMEQIDVQYEDLALIDLLVQFEQANKRAMQLTRRLADLQSEIRRTQAQIAQSRDGKL